MKTSIALSTVALALALTGCKGLRQWYTAAGYPCNAGTPEPACDYYKDRTKIVYTDDPYYKPGKTVLENKNWVFDDGYGHYYSYSGIGWKSPDGVFYGADGKAVNAAEDADYDVLGQASDAQERRVQQMSSNLARTYGLAEDRSVQIARSLNDWAVLGKTRTRTDADLRAFLKNLYGVQFNDAAAAFAAAETGDTSKLEGLNRTVASYWGTSPETSKEIIQGWYREYLTQ